MRRSDREITDRAEILAVMRRCAVCHLAMMDGARPYVVPLNFGLREEEGRLSLIFHSAAEGKKLDLLRENPSAAFSMVTDVAVVQGSSDKKCDCTAHYQSVLGSGTVRFLEGEEKVAALDALLETNGVHPAANAVFSPETLARTTVFCLDVETLTGKKNP